MTGQRGSPVTGETRDGLTYPFERVPEPGEALHFAPGVYWIRMPLQLTGLNHINLWLLADNTGWTIIDTGMASAEIQDHWKSIFATYFQGKPLKRVMCTHFHPDHMGLAGWLRDETGCHLLASRLEWLYGRMFSLDPATETAASALEHYRKIDMPAAHIVHLQRVRDNDYAQCVTTVPEQYIRIRDGDVLIFGEYDWVVIVGTGHAPEHACLYCEKLNMLIAGDQILPRITPHIGVYPDEAAANPLQDYMDSLERFRRLPADVLVLPAHNEPFFGLHARLDALIDHHEERLNLLEAALAGPKRVSETIDVMFRRTLKDHEIDLGFAEALAHLNCLIEQGRVSREADDAGVWRYRRVVTAMLSLGA